MITEGNIREIYDITGLTPLAGGYEFTFPYTSAQDVRVYTTGNRTDTEVSTSNYIIDESGATPKVVFIAGYSFPAGQTKLTIIRNVSYSQKLDLRNGDLIDADKLEGALDNITQQIQQVAEKVDRAILSSVSDTEPLSIPEASQRNNMLLGFDSEGKAIPVLTTDIEQKLAQALAAEESAITAKNAAENAQHEAESAQSAAETAQGKAETAQAAAESAEASSQTLLASIETKTEESIASINTTKTGAVGAVTTQQATSVAAVQAAQNTAESDIAGKRSSALTAIDTAKTTAVAAVNTQKETSVAAADREIVAKRDSALTDIQTARTNAVNAITTKKDQSLQEVEQLASERKAEINSLAANQKADVKQYTDSVVASAKTEIDTEKTTAVTAVQEEGDAKVAIIGSSGDAEVTRVQSVYQTDLNELKGDLSKIRTFLKPRMRNGSLGNSANANAVAIAEVQPILDNKYILKYDVDLNGGSIAWNVYLWDEANGDSDISLNKNSARLYEDYHTKTNFVIADFSGYEQKGFAVSLFVKDAEGNLISQRVGVNAKDIEVINVKLHEELTALFDTNMEDKNIITTIKPIMRNGSLGNSANANAVAIAEVQPILDNKYILKYDVDLNGGSIEWNVYLWDEANGDSDISLNKNSARLYNNYYTKTNFVIADFSEYEQKGFAVSISVFDASGNVISQRVGVNAKDIEVINVKLHEELTALFDTNMEDNIVQRNVDVLQNVYASSWYGVHGVGESNYKKKYSMLITTDVHGDSTRFGNAIEYLNAIPSIDAGCCLGDIVSSYANENTSWYNELIVKSKKPFYTVLGNHDCGNSTDAKLAIDDAELVAKFITPNENAMGMSGLTKPYYSFRVDNYKLAFIALWDFDDPQVKDTNGNYLVKRGTNCYSQEQIDWFISTLLNIPNDYNLVILRHSYYEKNTRYDCNFSQNRILNGNGTIYGDVDIIPCIVDAWMNGASFTQTFSPKSEYSSFCNDLVVSANFTSRGNGKFVCYIVGHSHSDIIAHSTEYPTQTIIGLPATSGGLWQNADADIPRVNGTKSEDAITVVSFDTDNKRINLVRVGSNITVDMIDRTMCSLSYS